MLNVKRLVFNNSNTRKKLNKLKNRNKLTITKKTLVLRKKTLGLRRGEEVVKSKIIIEIEIIESKRIKDNHRKHGCQIGIIKN